MRWTRNLALAVAGILALLATPADGATIDVNGTAFALSWTPATGPVAGYEVYASRNVAGGSNGFVYINDVSSNQVYFNQNNIGDLVVVRVRAFSAGKTVFGPYSPDSDVIAIKGFITLTQPGVPTIQLKCEDPSKPKIGINPTTGVLFCQ